MKISAHFGKGISVWLIFIAFLMPFSFTARASLVVFASTNSGTGQLDTNSFRLIALSNVQNTDGTFNTVGIPIVVKNPTGTVTNYLVQNNWLWTNPVTGFWDTLRTPDSSSNVITEGGCTLHQNMNPFITLIYSNWVSTNNLTQVAFNNNGDSVTNIPNTGITGMAITNLEGGVNISGTFGGDFAGPGYFMLDTASGQMDGQGLWINGSGGGITNQNGVYYGNGSGLTFLTGANVIGAVPIATTATTASVATNVVPGITITNPTTINETASGTYTGNGGGLTNLNAVALNYSSASNIIYIDTTSPNSNNPYFGNAGNPFNSIYQGLIYAKTNYNGIKNLTIYGNGNAATGYSTGAVNSTVCILPGQTVDISSYLTGPSFYITNPITINNYGSTLVGMSDPFGSGGGFLVGFSQTGRSTNGGSLFINGGHFVNIDTTDANLLEMIATPNFTNYCEFNSVSCYSYNTAFLGVIGTKGLPKYVINFNNVIAHAGGDVFNFQDAPNLTNNFNNCYFSATEEFTNNGFIGQNSQPIGYTILGGNWNFNFCTFKQTLLTYLPDMTISNSAVNFISPIFISQGTQSMVIESNSVVNIWGYIPPSSVTWDSTCTVNFNTPLTGNGSGLTGISSTYTTNTTVILYSISQSSIATLAGLGVSIITNAVATNSITTRTP